MPFSVWDFRERPSDDLKCEGGSSGEVLEALQGGEPVCPGVSDRAADPTLPAWRAALCATIAAREAGAPTRRALKPTACDPLARRATVTLAKDFRPARE